MAKVWKPGEFEARTQEVLKEEAKNPYQWYWCSFAVPGRCLGVLIVQAHGTVECAIRARSLGANPGGQLMPWPITEADLPAPEYRNRLLSVEEVRKLYPDVATLGELEKQ